MKPVSGLPGFTPEVLMSGSCVLTSGTCVLMSGNCVLMSRSCILMSGTCVLAMRNRFLERGMRVEASIKRSPGRPSS